MKKFSTCLALSLIASASVHGQSCTWSPDLHFPGRWATTALASNGNLFAAGAPLAWTHEFRTALFAADGTLLSSRHTVPTDPSAWLIPSYVVPMADEGSTVFGTIQRDAYVNYFGIRYDAVGDVVWARIYMIDNRAVQDQTWGMLASGLANGDFMMVVMMTDGFNLVRLNGNGELIWIRRYQPSGPTNYSFLDRVIEDPDGGLLFTGGASGDLFMMHTDASGDLDWHRRFAGNSNFPTSSHRTSNGDYLVARYAGGSEFVERLIRTDASGNVLWANEYSEPRGFRVVEIPGGDLLATYYDYNTSGIVRMDADGIPISTWSTAADTAWIMLGLDGDSVMIHSSISTEGGLYDVLGLLQTDDPTDFSCAMPLATTFTYAPATLADSSGTVTEYADSLRTWTLSLVASAVQEEVDVITGLAAGQARPGFNHSYYGWITNEGDPTSGPITATMTCDPSLQYVDAYPAPTSVVNNVITWSGLDALDFLNDHTVWAHFTVPVSTPLGTVFNSTFTAAQDSAEFTLLNNASTTTVEVTGSYDPNEKRVRPEGFFNLDTDTVLDYTIYFQNTGTDTAFTVVLRDTLPLDVDTRTFRMNGASHPFTYTLTGNGLLTVTFNNILLPDSNTNEPLSHGLVSFSIKPILPLALGTVISNEADIYFDFNEPVITDPAVVVVTDATGMIVQAPRPQFSVFPVPANDRLQVALPAGFKPQFGQIVGADGRRQPAQIVSTKEDRLDLAIQHLRPGMYVLTLFGTNGQRLAARFTKE
jgi:uncharacterized repeat protein (TIGR01451 family)